MPATNTVTASSPAGLVQVQVLSAFGQMLHADLPTAEGGVNSGFEINDLLIAALAADTNLAIRREAMLAGLAGQEITVQLSYSPPAGGAPPMVECRLDIGGLLREPERRQLLTAAAATPLYPLLAAVLTIQTVLLARS